MKQTGDDSMPGVAEFDLTGLDSPSLAPADLDLPQPVMPQSHPPGPRRSIPSAPDLDLPAPVELDLPAPAMGSAQPPRFAGVAAPPQPTPDSDNPMHAEGLDLPTPVELDLPTPVELNLPAPVEFDLPTPVDADLLQPANMEVEPAGMAIEPAHMDVEPAGTGLQPVEVDLLEPAHTELQPADLDLEPVGQSLQPVGPKATTAVGDHDPIAAAAAAAASVGTEGALPAPTRIPSPANKVNPARRPSGGVMIGLAGLLVVSLGGVGVVYSGILDPPPDPLGDTPTAQRGAKTMPVPEGPAVDRSAEVLAKFREDTPQAYRDALAAAEANQDAAGAAEAAALFHLRYGPQDDMAAMVPGLLSKFSNQQDAFVTRVVGLAALTEGQLEPAEIALVGDDVRTRLYRGFLRMAQGRADDALAEAEAVLAATPDDHAAMCLKMEALQASDPANSMTEVESIYHANTSHPGILAQYVQVMIDNGRFARARATLAVMEPVAGDAKGFDARIEELRGDVAMGSGRYIKAAQIYDKILEATPGKLDVTLKKVRALLEAKQLSEADAAVSGLLASQPEAVELHVLRAEVAIAGGETKRAADAIAIADPRLPTDARVPFLLGQLHALKLEVEEAQKMFATARERDASFYRATVEEAGLLAKIKELDAGLELLGEARATAEKDGRAGDAAQLLLARARLLLDANRPTEAKAAADEAFKLDPSSNEAQLMRGLLRIRGDERTEGEADLVAVFERTGAFPGLARPLGMIYLRDNRVDVLDKLIGSELNGADTPTDLVLLGARLRILQGKVDEAKILVEAGLAANPNDWEGHMLMSDVLLYENKYEAAMASVERARPPQPDAELYLQRGRVYEYNGRHDDARPLYYKAAELDPTLHEARFLYGRALQLAGDDALAVKQLEMVVEAPGAEGMRWLGEAWQYLGMAQSKVGNAKAAAKSLERATTLDPKLGGAFAELGQLQERDNKHGAAISSLKQAIALAPPDQTPAWYANALMDLGRAQNKSGKAADARATFKKFLSVAPPDHTGRSEALRLSGG